MAKKFEDMTPDEKREAFEAWVNAKNSADEKPVEFLVGAIEEALTSYLAGDTLEEAMDEVKDALVGALQSIDETKAMKE